MIELKDVSFTYESGETENSLKHIDLTIHDGETILPPASSAWSSALRDAAKQP